MGFDQYHEPAGELPAETRTFARLCASLTEEAEAIGWYEPLWREIAEGILFQEGDIVEAGEESEAEATEEEASRGAPLAGSESLGIGSMRGNVG